MAPTAPITRRSLPPRQARSKYFADENNNDEMNDENATDSESEKAKPAKKKSTAKRVSTKKSVTQSKKFKTQESTSKKERFTSLTDEPKTSTSRNQVKVLDNDEDYVESEGEDSVDSDYQPIETKRKSTVKSIKRKSTKQSTPRAKKTKTPDSTPNKTLPISVTKPTPGTSQQQSGDNDDDDDSDDGADWEEVEDAEMFDLENYNPTLPENLKISVTKQKKPKNKIHWLEVYIRQRINKARKDIQLDCHKTHLLLSIYRLQYLNEMTTDRTVQALIFSLDQIKFKLNADVSRFFQKFSEWTRKTFNILIDKNDDIYENIYDELIRLFEAKSIKSSLALNLMIISILRTLNIMTRLCYLVDPIPIKPPDLLNRHTDMTIPIDPEKLSQKSTKVNGKGKEAKSKKTKAQNVETNEPLVDAHCYWIEIFDKEKKRWVSCDFVEEVYNEPYTIASKAPVDITYVLAIDNDGHVADVTPRYASEWVSYSMKKRRLEDEWWTETLDLFRPEQLTVHQDADRIEFDEIMSNVELPKRFSDYKNHPLFALQRDILKFQAIYPPDAPPLGFFREQPVFSRDCVRTLRSRETWLREARVVKPFEKPYKQVPSKFKWKKNTLLPGHIPEKENLELFGEWQTKPYEPPVATNGVVPRNAYGNVELFKPCMLPINTVHLRLPGLARIASKLNIDCAAAVVGFDTGKHGHGGAHPVTDGHVVCSEFKDILLDAWRQERDIQKNREKERREKRVLDNWKKLIKGLIIRQNLKIKYG